MVRQLNFSKSRFKMNMKIHYVFAVMLFFSFALTSQAQKVGYINSQELISQLPEVKEANANIETLKKQLQKKGQNMIASLQAKYQSLQERQQSGDISPIQLEQEAAKLKEEETKIAQFEQSSQEKIMTKSQELLAPIQDKINNAIKNVADEQGYDYIFDASMGMVLYAAPETDVSSAVKAKLGI